ncbi:hypothetical protein FOPG_11541 [Fusarium oxysporum f. sp. conglutinans race 2 54008]|uniref:DUF7580 domain-containing protein n=2 Tax=Fusarium oxysporum f. sp. conglutinans TaxID=100902 RepID=F9FAN2_FUSOF|nr:hypothetical protein FOXB_03458 [Fusarium oxysporum f. sp. conglutinans Fo5176]EXL73084.1 hypothetical protein FOPG_11541 [Fusarium oxysporum f. sp. conglutinans race 2 54008]KAG6985944.1 hypothetical protein FocnCong_v003784 [Fusarium oxysporum f. sp. conglutinans]KAI8405678.1 hypothetical protein FOFC_15165 [Fusarium oxysporum]
MSGLEVAGIVLGSIPLLIIALEKYTEGLSTLHRWRKYKRELQSLIRNLETERIKLQNVCEKLLLDLVPHYKIEALIDNPMGDLWREEETLKKVQFRLGKGFKVFQDTANDLRATLFDLGRLIESQGEGMFPGLKRAVFTLSRSQYADILTEIRGSVSNLENMTDRNMELEPARRVRSKQKLFTILRDLSESLYRALRSSLTCSCRHDIGLGLETRKVEGFPGDDEQKLIGLNSFKISVSYKTDFGPLKTWQDFNLKPQRLCPGPSPPEVMPFPSSRLGRTSGKKRVQFSDSPQGFLTTTHATPRVAKVPTSLTARDHTVPVTICSDLCQITKNNASNAFPESAPNISGIIHDRSLHVTTEFQLCPIQVSPFQNPQSISLISLRDILYQTNKSTHLPTRDRHNLAVVISSSFLQLHGSPWLPDRLDSRDIFFFTYQGSPLFTKPLLMKNLPDRNDNHGYKTVQSPPSANPALWSLGLLLIELILGRALDINNKQSWGSEYFIAYELLPEVRMISLNYGTAVMRCLGGELHSTDYLSGGADFCQDVYAGIVALLERDLENA